MAAAEDEQSSGFFGKLKARLNRGKDWLASELLGFGSQPLDEATVEELETRLLTADVGVEATTWLVDEMSAASKRTPDTAGHRAAARDGARLAANGRGAARPSRAHTRRS